MRSDAKLGLALVMLVIGFAIAFCFPRAGRTPHFATTTETVPSLYDPTIEFVPIRTLRDEDDHDIGVEPDASYSDVFGSQETLGLSEEVLPQVSPTQNIGELIGQRLQETVPDQSPQRFAEPQDNAETPTVAEAAESSSPEFTSYVIQAGDTLSGISMKTLGSYSRYLDIYDANRDVLSSPDDLRLGLKLKIPQRDAAQVAINTEPTEDATPSEAVVPPASEPIGNSILTDRRVNLPVNQIHPQGAVSHRVSKGETLEKIAVRYFGTIRAVEQLQRVNPELRHRDRKLIPGMVLRLSR